MAKQSLETNYKDDIMNSAMGGKRRYKIINNSDGTISLVDVTLYDQIGDNYGAGQVNATNQAVNESADKNKVIQDIETIRNVTEDGYIAGARALKQVDDSLGGLDVRYNPETGQPEWKERGADTFVPFSSEKMSFVCATGIISGTYSKMPITYYNTDAVSNSDNVITFQKSGTVRVLMLGQCVVDNSTTYSYLQVYKNNVEIKSASSKTGTSINMTVDVTEGDTLYFSVKRGSASVGWITDAVCFFES